MGEFFFEYGLFAAKALTLCLAIIVTVICIIAAAASKNQSKDNLEIEKINDTFEEYEEILEAELLTKEELKAQSKQKKKEDKEKRKAEKKRLKEGDDTPEKGRLFVLRFEGDMQASEVEHLRESITAILTIAKPEDTVLAILESAGGLVHNYGLAASQLARIRAKNIHLIAAVDLVAASGGYMMACVANEIIAAPFAVIGSIGVLGQVTNFNRLLTKNYVDVEEHTSGEFKRTLTMLGKNTDAQREKFKSELQETHELFKSFVHSYRPKLDIETVSTGEHWYGHKALDLQLIDDIKTSDDFLLEKSKDYDIYEISYTTQETIRDKLSSLLENMSVNIFGRLYQKFGSKIIT